MTDPANKTVLITGAGGGFGREMVRQFKEAGSKLILTDITNDAMRDVIDTAGDALIAAVPADLAREAGSDAVIQACNAHNTVPDILVNNAGLGTAGRLDHIPNEQWETLVQLNLLAPMRLINHFTPAMIDRKSGHFVNISSLAGWLGSKGLSAYCATKFGLRGFGEALAADLHDTGVHVTNVYPCFSRTAILDSPQYGYEEKRVVPDYLISEPADVVERMIKGVRRNKLHVFPDRYARQMHYVVRFVPWLVPKLDRYMQRKAIEAGRLEG